MLWYYSLKFLGHVCLGFCLVPNSDTWDHPSELEVWFHLNCLFPIKKKKNLNSLFRLFSGSWFYMRRRIHAFEYLSYLLVSGNCFAQPKSSKYHFRNIKWQVSCVHCSIKNSNHVRDFYGNSTQVGDVEHWFRSARPITLTQKCGTLLWAP